MKIGEALDRLTISKETITEYFDNQYGSSEFLVKDTSVFTEDVVRYFSEEISSGKSLGFVKSEQDFRVRPSELTVVTGVSSHGKSLWLSQVILALMGQQN